MKSACHIACSCCLKQEDRCHYFQEVFRLASEHRDGLYQMRASAIFTLEEAVIASTSVILHDDFIVDFIIYSNFPLRINCDNILISIIKASDSGLSPFRKKTHIRNPSLTFKNHEHLPNFRPIRKQLPPEINVNSTYEKRNGKIVSCSVGCANAHELLKRADSTTNQVESDIIIKGDYSLCMSMNNVTLEPGKNKVQLKMKTEDKGMFKLSQICYKIKQLELLKTLSQCDLQFEVVCNEPSVQLKPLKLDKFLAGIQQDVILVINTGSYYIPNASTISLEFNGPVSLITDRGDNTLKLDAAESQETVEYKLSLFLETKQQLKQTTDIQMSCKLDCWDKIMTYNLIFYHPFHITHKLHTSKEKKFLQLTVIGNVKSEFTLLRPELSCLNCLDLELIPFNKLEHQWKVSCDQTATFVWSIKSNISELPNLDLCFNVKYTSIQDKSGEQRLFSYICHLEQFQTQYLLDYELKTSEEKCCKTGESTLLQIHVQKASTCNKPDSRLVYQVSDNTSWAVAGKSTGVFDIADDEYSTTIDVIPLQSGLQHLPLVTLYQYVDSNQNQNEVWVRKPSDSEIKDGKKSQNITRFTPFNTGEVYNNSKCQQVHIQPTKSSLDTEFIVAL
ncbi:hypothetical protein LOTGIDRAFT_154413 [Lottia gigantea]|uniref:Trafficking protein particle complex subunit 11 C-terminal domain-containing protein n=1 Tax=Lottia gigantea TaxID=225164 RepID=V3ZDW7_LOTGI|nr:hypothetical protein LOTGIDRAFT_154413 [Lottia gigantea]ESO89313.1 hypothetical protein LOTGIDRAFT_154413 [Lottia gigantea]